MWNSNIEAGSIPVSMPPYVNPLLPDYFADPFLWKHGEDYFAVATGPDEAAGKAGFGGGIFPMLHSRDLVRWRRIGWALDWPPEEAGDGACFWAPEVAYAEGRFHLYFSMGRGDKDHRLRVATSLSPQGPYRLEPEPLTHPDEWPFAIDPHPFRDDDGRWHLFFAVDFLDAADPPVPGGLRAGTALVAQPLQSMTSLEPGGSRVILRARHDWQRFQRNRPMYHGRYDWHTLEGPAVLKHDGLYYCFYSGGCWQTESYGVDYGVAESVMGPYSDAGGEHGPRILKTLPGRVIGPGHNSFVLAPDGRSLFIAYHAWDPGMAARRLCLDRLLWTPQGPRSPGPTWTPQFP